MVINLVTFSTKILGFVQTNLFNLLYLLVESMDEFIYWKFWCKSVKLFHHFILMNFFCFWRNFYYRRLADQMWVNQKNFFPEFEKNDLIFTFQRIKNNIKWLFWIWTNFWLRKCLWFLNMLDSISISQIWFCLSICKSIPTKSEINRK